MEKIADIELQMSQLENQKKQLVQQYKEQERKDRTKRLCKRMGLLESMLPDTITLTDEQFKIFLEKTIFSESAKKILSELSVQVTAVTAANTIQSTPESSADESEDGNCIPRTPCTHGANRKEPPSGNLPFKH